MKKTIAIIMILALSIMVCGCNVKVLDTNWQFNYAYITFPNGNIKEVQIDRWAEDETSVTIQSKDGNIYCVSMMNCLMTKEQWDMGE